MKKNRFFLVIILFVVLSLNIVNVPPAFANLTVTGTNNWNKAFSDVRGAAKASSIVTAENYRGSLGTIGSDGNWRVNRQPSASDISNIQIQRNGADNPSTAGAVLVPHSYGKEINSTPPNSEVKRAKTSELTRAIRNGLNESVKSHKNRDNRPNEFEIQVFKVDGQFSA